MYFVQRCGIPPYLPPVELIRMLLLQRSGGLLGPSGRLVRTFLPLSHPHQPVTIPHTAVPRGYAGITMPYSTAIDHPSHILAIVVGAHLHAEIHDRPTACHVRDALQAKITNINPTHFPVLQSDPTNGPIPLEPVVMTDLWYLNQDWLRSQPTISIGHPTVNALGAYLADKLPSIFTIDNELLVQFDPELVDPIASCWGENAQLTAQAAAIFLEKHADRFLSTLH